jgi:hypothetical protein
LSYAGLPAGFTVARDPTPKTYAGLPDGFAVQDHAQPGPQPSMLDKIVATVGRPIHDNIVAPLEGAASGFERYAATNPILGIPGLASAIVTHGRGGPTPVSNLANQAVEQPYQASLDANRNTPGYAAARAVADKVQTQRGGSGFQDQITAPFNPTLAGLGAATGGLDAFNANADSQASAQGAYQQAHPYLSMAGNALGGLLMAPERGPLPTPTARPFVPSVADLKGEAKALYSKIDNSGVQVSSDALNAMGDSLQDKFSGRLDPTLHPDATAAYNRVAQFATDGAKGAAPATFTDLDNLRRVVQDATGSIKPADRAMSRMILDHVDDFVGGLQPGDLDTSLQDQLRQNLVSATSAKGQVAKQIKSIEQNKPGALAARGAAGAKTRETYMGLQDQLPQAEAARQEAHGAFQNETDLLNAGPKETIDALKQARDLWSRASQAQLIQQQIDKAGIKASANYSQSGMENALRQQFKSLALNDRAMARLTPEVQQAVKDVAKGSPVGNVLRAVGKYAPHGPVATAAGMGLGYTLGGIGGATEGGLASLAVPMLGEAARTGATAMTRSAAQRAMDIAAAGRGSAPSLTSAPVFQMPNVAAGRLPRAMLPLMLPTLQQRQQQPR